MQSPLDNIIWNTLSGAHAEHSVGTAAARRYAPGFSPILGFADPEHPDFDALVPHCEAGERFYTSGWSGAVPTCWQIEVESSMFLMVYEGALPDADEAPDAIPLGPQHAQQAFELATLTNPGPFGPRTIELGDYFGFFDGDRLIAMSGERFQAGEFHEVSGVCTHPDFQGRGMARRLMTKLIRRQLLRGETPFLHVMHDNAVAHRLYEKLGFRDYKEFVVRVVTRGERYRMVTSTLTP